MGCNCFFSLFLFQQHSSYQGVGQEINEESEWPQHNPPPAPAIVEGAYAEQPDLSGYQEQHTYGTGYGYSGEHQKTVQHAPVNWAAHSQQGSMANSHQASSSSYGASSVHHSAESQGAYEPSGLQGGAYSSITNNGVHHGVQHGVHHGSHKVTKHTWTSHQSTSGSGELQHGPHYTVEQELGNHGQGQSGVEHSFSSIAHQAHSTKDLSSILGGQAAYQSHELHPTIQQALGNVIGHSSAHPAQHTVHKISHIKKTSVQNVGQEPVHIQSTSSNDDISLSHLIEELKMLENSPKHVNITWCEEKIKEFLQTLRRKQASGVFINQQVQEETLHQILTHETKEENTDSSGGVYEPVMTKVTVRPLGGEAMSQSHFESETFSHHQDSHSDRSEAEAPPPPTDQKQEESKSIAETEVITVIPHITHQQPEVMAHQQETVNQSPPLTSDNTKDLQELDLELPEFVPFEHGLSEDIQAAESNVHRETRPLPKPAEGELSKTDLDSTETLDHGESGYHEGEVKHELTHDTTIQHHIIEGRPQAPEVDLEGAAEENQEEKVMHSEKSSGSEEGLGTQDTAGHAFVSNSSAGGHYSHSHQTTVTTETLHKQQLNYDTLIEELIQLESIPGHQAIDKCEEKIQEFLEILKFQQEQGFGRNQQELQRLHQTLIEQAQERSKQLENPQDTTLAPTSFWRRVQKKIKTTYDNAKDRAKDVIG